MGNSGLFVGFGAPHVGRETQSARVFGEAMEYFARLQQQGDIESFEAALLEAHGGDLNGFMLLRGDPAKLAMVRGSEEWGRLVARAIRVVGGFGVVSAGLHGGARRLVTANEALTADLR